MKTLQDIQDKSTQNEFDKKVLSAVQHLRAYVKHRLYIGESLGVLPKNMYTSNDLIDAGILKLYENGYNTEDDALAIKLKLFSYVDHDLDVLFKTEAFHKNTISTTSILEQELDSLEEHFYLDADLDYVMKEDFDDISYDEDHKHKSVFLYADKDNSLLNTFDLKDISLQKAPVILGHFYNGVPTQIANIVDLYAFGKLDFESISKLKGIEMTRLEKIFKTVQKSFRKHLG